jgi:hypothetical protein
MLSWILELRVTGGNDAGAALGTGPEWPDACYRSSTDKRHSDKNHQGDWHPILDFDAEDCGIGREKFPGNRLLSLRVIDAFKRGADVIGWDRKLALLIIVRLT